MAQIYFALVDTPGFFASIIRKVTGIDYIHVVLSMDEELQEAAEDILQSLYWLASRRKIQRKLSGRFLRRVIRL